MNLAESVLEKLVSWRPTGEGRQVNEIQLSDHGWTVQATADRTDSVGYVLHRLAVRRNAPISDDFSKLEAHAVAISKRVTGLLEALRVVEVDRTRNVAILRSDCPPTKGDSVAYYEVALTGRNHAVVQRFQASKSTPAKKEPIAFSLTHEVIAKLTNDLVRD
jgi:hypothetical protein